MATKVTAEEIDKRVGGIHTSIRRVGEYKNYDTRIEWKCDCGHTWEATPNNIISKKSGCPVCALVTMGKKKSSGQADRVVSILAERGIYTKQHYTKVTARYDFGCNKCGHEWQTTMNCVVNSGSGCPKCAGLAKMTNTDVDARLLAESRPITRVGEYVNATTKIQWKCHKCQGVWEASPDSVLNNNTSGCAVCGRLGTLSRKYFERNPQKRDVMGYVYLVEGEYNNIRFLKVGITEHTVEKRFSADGKYNIKMIHAKQLPLGEAYEIEQMLLQRHITSLYKPSENFGGKTECLVYNETIKRDILDTLMADQ